MVDIIHRQLYTENMIRKFPGAKEYYVIVTTDCNLNCSYCFRDSCTKNLAARTPTYKVRQVSDFILADLEKCKPITATLVFSGGEPLLNQELIRELMEKVQYPELKYWMITNGMLLDKADIEILNKLEYLFISFDGEHRSHDQCRGKGSFQKILSNLFKLKSYLPVKTVARMTLPTSASLLYAVMGIINIFEFVHWQIENTPATDNDAVFLERYDRDLDILIEFWIEHLREGIIKSIVPFQGIMATLLSQRRHDLFRCGACGDNMAVINVDGNIYCCDELVGDDDFKVGNIETGLMDIQQFRHTDIFEPCRECDISSICAGRCLHSLKKFPLAKINFYCTATRMIVEKLSARVEEVRLLINKGIIGRRDIDHPIQDYTEVIP